MAHFPKKLRLKLIDREKENALRDLPIPNTLVDFSSNDYLGLSKNQKIFDKTSELIKNGDFGQNGATGSRLLSGNHSLYGQLENVLKEFHEVTSALVFNSGYDANIGFFGSVPQRGDVVFMMNSYMQVFGMASSWEMPKAISSGTMIWRIWPKNVMLSGIGIPLMAKSMWLRNLFFQWMVIRRI